MLFYSYVLVFLNFFIFFQILPVAGAVRVVSRAVPNSMLVVERTVLVLVCSGRRASLHDFAALYVAGEQRRSHLGHETVR